MLLPNEAVEDDSVTGDEREDIAATVAATVGSLTAAGAVPGKTEETMVADATEGDEETAV